LTYGDRVHSIYGELVITDHINKLEAVVTYNPKSEKSVLKSFKSKLFKSSDELQPTDHIAISIKQKASNSSKSKVEVAEGQGSWLEYIEFEGKTYWTIEEEVPQWKLVNDDRLREDFKAYLLPSDSFLRVDHEHLRLKEFETSEKEKYELEE